MTSTIDSKVFDDVDVFGLFDAAAGHDLGIDPYPALAEMRRQGGVLEVDFHDVLGVDRSVVVTSQSSGYKGLDAPMFSAVSFEADDRVMRDSKNFSQEIQRRAFASTFGIDSMEALDPPAHRRHRGLVERAFTRRALDAWSSDIVEPLAQRSVRRLLERDDRADLVNDFTFWYPGEVITQLLGLPEEDIPRFMRIAISMGNPGLHPELAALGSTAMAEWIQSIIEDRRSNPGDDNDLLSLLLDAEADGERLSDEEIIRFVRFLFPAGFETTYRTLSNLLVGLFTSGQWELLRADRSLIPQAVEEGLRWETSVLAHPRYAVRDVEVCGVAIPAGAVVCAYHGSANRDESRWADADRFDLLRPRLPHATFGFGIHMCLGKHLARVESIAALNALLDVFPALRLDEGADPEDYRIRGLTYRSPHRIPVVLA